MVSRQRKPPKTRLRARKAKHPRRVTSAELRKAMENIIARHGLDPSVLRLGPLWLSAWLAEHPGTPEQRALDSVDGYVVNTWVRWELGRLDHVFIEWADAAPSSARAAVSEILRFESRQGFADRRDTLRRIYAESPRATAAENAVRPQLDDKAIAALREEWVTLRAEMWSTLASELGKHQDLASKDDDSDTYADIDEALEAADLGYWTPGRVQILGAAAAGLARDATAAGIEATHPLWKICREIARAVKPLKRAIPADGH